MILYLTTTVHITIVKHSATDKSTHAIGNSNEISLLTNKSTSCNMPVTSSHSDLYKDDPPASIVAT